MWNDDLFSEAQPLWEAARAHGLRRGVTQYLMLPNRALGFLSFSRCSTREIPILSDELQLKNAATGARKSDGSDAFK